MKGPAMSREAYRYTFDRSVAWRDLEESLLLAVLAVECLHGEARVRLDGRYRLDGDRSICVIDTATDVGRDINRIFTGFVSREFGRASFRVERVTPDEAPADCATQPEAHEQTPSGASQ